VGHDTPSVSETASPAQWQEPTWSDLPDLDLPSSPYCILFVGPNNSATAKLSLEEEFTKVRDAFSFRRGSDFWSQRVVFERLFFASKNDLAQGLLKHKPTILHFAFHGQKSALELFQGDLRADDSLQAMAGWSGADKQNNLHLIVANATASTLRGLSLSTLILLSVMTNQSKIALQSISPRVFIWGWEQNSRCSRASRWQG